MPQIQLVAKVKENSRYCDRKRNRKQIEVGLGLYWCLVSCQMVSVKCSVGGNFDSPQTATIWFMFLLGNAIKERGSRKLGVFTVPI